MEFCNENHRKWILVIDAGTVAYALFWILLTGSRGIKISVKGGKMGVFCVDRFHGNLTLPKGLPKKGPKGLPGISEGPLGCVWFF